MSSSRIGSVGSNDPFGALTDKLKESKKNIINGKFFMLLFLKTKQKSFSRLERNYVSSKLVCMASIHSDQFLVEMFQNHGLKEWISLRIMLLWLWLVIMSLFNHEK